MNSERIGKYVREQREKAGLSQSELAALLLVGPETVDDWERGVSVPDTSLLLPLAGILGVSVEDVLDAGAPSFDPILTPEPEIGEPRAESAPPTAATASDEIAALPTVLPPEGSALASGAKKLSFSDYFSTKKIKKTSRAYFGEEHEWKIKRKFLRSGTFRRHSRNEFDRAVTQGMFKNDPSHKNGIARSALSSRPLWSFFPPSFSSSRSSFPGRSGCFARFSYSWSAGWLRFWWRSFSTSSDSSCPT